MQEGALMKKSQYRYVVWLVIVLSALLIFSIVTSEGMNGISDSYLLRITPYTIYGAFFFFLFLIRRIISKKPVRAGKRRKVILSILDRVRTEFPVRPNPYRIPDNIYRLLQDNPHDEHAIAALLADIHYFYGMDTSGLRCDIRYIHDYDTQKTEDKDNPAGSYSDCGDGTRKIVIYLRKSYNLYTVTSIAAHETMHHFLEQKKIKYTNIEENELLTDIAALYLGFEEYMVKGNSDLYDGGNQFRTVGYLTKSEITFVIKNISKG